MSARTDLGFTDYVDPGVDCKKMLVTDEKVAKELGVKLRIETPSKSEKPGLIPKVVDSPNLTEESHALEHDIETILKRYSPQQMQQVARGVDSILGGDFTKFQNLQDAYIQMEAAREEFLRLPPEVRKSFDNNPGNMVKAFDLAQAGNKVEFDRLVALGILEVPKTHQDPPKETPKA